MAVALTLRYVEKFVSKLGGKMANNAQCRAVMIGSIESKTTDPEYIPVPVFYVPAPVCRLIVARVEDLLFFRLLLRAVNAQRKQLRIGLVRIRRCLQLMKGQHMALRPPATLSCSHLRHELHRLNLRR